MPNREDLRAIARQAQLEQFAEATQSQQPLTTAQLGSIDPNTGLDIVELPDGGTVTGQRIFSAGHPQGTFVRATQATGGQVTLDWRNAPEIPEIAEDDPRRRFFRRKKETDPADVPVLFITKETKAEAVSCRCTTYKRNEEGKFKELCDGSGGRLPSEGTTVTIPSLIGGKEVRQPDGSIARPPYELSEIDILEIDLSWAGDPVKFTGDIIAPNYLEWANKSLDSWKTTIDEMLKQGSSVIVRTKRNFVFGDGTVAGHYWYDIAMPSPNEDPTLGKSMGASFFTNQLLPGDVPLMGDRRRVYDGVYDYAGNLLTNVNDFTQQVLNPLLGNKVSHFEWVSFPCGNFSSNVPVSNGQGKSLSIYKMDSPESPRPNFTVFVDHRQGTSITAKMLGAVCEEELIVVGDGTHGYFLLWEAEKYNPAYKGVVLFDFMPFQIVPGVFGGIRDTFSLISSTQRIGGNLVTLPGSQFAASNSSIADMIKLRTNIPYWIPPRQNNTVRPSKETIVFWLGGCYQTPIKITELTADDPYDAYLSNTSEKIFVTIKASKEEGYKDLDLKKRPWCTITTWEVDKATGDISTQQFRNPQEVTTNQDDWQKDWAHDYNPIDPVVAKPAKFNIPTNRFGVSTANQTYNLTPFVEAADPQLTPKLVDISLVSSSIPGAGSVLSWDTNNLTFVYKGNTASLYQIEFSYTIDDGASTATSTITLSALMLAPNMVKTGDTTSPFFGKNYEFSIRTADNLGNVPQVRPGRTLTFTSITLESIGVESGSHFASNGLLVTYPARAGTAVSTNPLGQLISVDLAAGTLIWRDFTITSIFVFAEYCAKILYTITDGEEIRTGIFYVRFRQDPPF